MKYLKIFKRDSKDPNLFGPAIKLTSKPGRVANGQFRIGDEKEYDQSQSVPHTGRKRYIWARTPKGMNYIDRSKRADSEAEAPDGSSAVRRGYSALGYEKRDPKDYRATFTLPEQRKLEDFKDRAEDYESFENFPIMSLLGPGYIGTDTKEKMSFYAPKSSGRKNPKPTAFQSPATKGEIVETPKKAYVFGDRNDLYNTYSDAPFSEGLDEPYDEDGYLRNIYDVEGAIDPIDEFKDTFSEYYPTSGTALRDLYENREAYRDKKKFAQTALLLMEGTPVSPEDIESGNWDPQRDAMEESQLKKAKALKEIPVWDYVTRKDVSDYDKSIAAKDFLSAELNKVLEANKAKTEEERLPLDEDTLWNVAQEIHTPMGYKGADNFLTEILPYLETLSFDTPKEQRVYQEWVLPTIKQLTEAVPEARSYSVKQALSRLILDHFVNYPEYEYSLDLDNLLDKEFNFNDPTVGSDKRIKDISEPKAVSKKNLLAKRVASMKY